MNRQQFNLSLGEAAKLDDIKCACGHNVWLRAVFQKQLPTTHPANFAGTAGRVDVNFLMCAKCGKPYSDIIMKKEKANNEKD
jgi:hypothetical protein